MRTLGLLKLNGKKQLPLYLSAILFIYLILVSQQRAVLSGDDLTEKELLELLELARNDLLLVALWWNFLAFRILNYTESAEVVRCCQFPKFRWWCVNMCAYLAVFLPYLLWFGRQNPWLARKLPSVLLQILFWSLAEFAVLLSCSALAGAVGGPSWKRSR